MTSSISSAHSSMDYRSYFTPATRDDRKLSIKWQKTLVQDKENVRAALLKGSKEDDTQPHEDQLNLITRDITIMRDEHSNSTDTILPITAITTESSDPMPQQISIEFTLNEKQHQAFVIITDHLEGKSFLKSGKTVLFFNENMLILYHIADMQEQLLMCVPGPGGTGKSQLIKALINVVTNRKHFLRKLAPTSIAASEIDGLTIHSFLGPISYAKKKKTVRPGDAKVTSNWHHIQYIFINEMSMVGLHLLSQIHKLLCIAKCKSTEPFGGINLVFFGDFILYPPVLDKPLYRDMLAEENNTRTKLKQKTELDTQYEVGRALWLQLNTVVQLIRQMRTDDSAFLEAQNRLRYGQCTTEDHKLLSTRVIGHQSCPVKPLDDIEWKEAPVLVFRNDLRTELNNLAVISAAREIGVVPVVCIAHDTFNADSAVNEKLRKFILRLSDNKTKGLCGYLSLVIDELDNETSAAATTGDFPPDTIFIRKPLYALVEIQKSNISSKLDTLPQKLVSPR
ncbi:unnamed protein product [Didymodactylos carnosus]|uniref:ATP-dependent DNA helicase n=1 Tax=Didymodactylos carnosus TaxID=1234261 RepID=A0A815VDL2_9BILA|nr:unnamed protein product [Didymodactylos carnosus]CAF4388357.1 unnamed protein product [Didymodactylos carnosus]